MGRDRTDKAVMANGAYRCKAVRLGDAFTLICLTADPYYAQ